MEQLDRILLATKMEDSYAKLLSMALAIAESAGATLDIAHVIEQPGLVPYSVVHQQAAMVAPAPQAIDIGHVRDWLSSYIPTATRRVETQIRIEIGSPETCLIEASRQVDLLIVGSPKKAQYFGNSLIQKLIQGVDIPVLIAPVR